MLRLLSKFPLSLSHSQVDVGAVGVLESEREPLMMNKLLGKQPSNLQRSALCQCSWFNSFQGTLQLLKEIDCGITIHARFRVRCSE